MGLYSEKNLNKTAFMYTMGNGSVFEFFSVADEERLRGRKRNVLYVNEANELSQIQWQQLKMRTTRFSIIDYNPSFSEEHWICKEVNTDNRTFHFISTYKDNPFLEQTIVDEIESLQWKNKSLWQVYGLGLQAIVEGLVFPEYELIEEIPPVAKRRYVGCDYGFTNDPTAIVEVACDGERMYIDELAYKTQMLTTDIIRELKDKAKGKRVASESADPRLVQEIYLAGVNIIPVKKFSGSIDAGLNKMHEYKICITKRSTNIIKEFKTYTYQQDKEGKWLNQPIDYANHAIDAIRYVVLTFLFNERTSSYESDLGSI